MRYEVRNHPLGPGHSIVFDTYHGSAVVMPGAVDGADWLTAMQAESMAKRLNRAYLSLYPVGTKCYSRS